VSKIPKRNYVKKNMDIFHKHKVEPNAKIYDRNWEDALLTEEYLFDYGEDWDMIEDWDNCGEER